MDNRKAVSENNYIVNTPGRIEKSQIYHVNLLKPYLQRIQLVNLIIEENSENGISDDEFEIPQINSSPEEYDFQNIVMESNLLEERCSHEHICQVALLLGKYQEVFCNNPGRTDMIIHDIELTSNIPIRLRPHQTSPRQTEILNAEIKKMLELNIIIEEESNYTCPMILVESPGRDPDSVSTTRS